MTLNVAIGPVSSLGGTRQHILSIVEYSKHNLHIIKSSPFSLYYSRYRGVGFTLARRPNLPLFDPYCVFMAGVILPKYDVVHFHGYPLWRDLFIKPRNTHAKYVYTVHQIYFRDEFMNEKSWRTFDNLNKRMIQYCRKADTVISVAKHAQNYLKDKYSIDSVYIPNCFDFYSCEKAQPQRFREKYGIRDDFYLYIGGFSVLKRPQFFIELAKRMQNRLFVMCGSNSNLQRYYLKNKLKNLIYLGYLSHEDVLDSISACRVLVVPSIREMFSIAIIEGMACKKPVVATNTTGPNEIIKDGINSYLFETDDLDDLYKKACLAWEHSEVGERACEKIKRFSCRVIIKQIDDFYENIVRE